MKDMPTVIISNVIATERMAAFCLVNTFGMSIKNKIR